MKRPKANARMSACVFSRTMSVTNSPTPIET